MDLTSVDCALGRLVWNLWSLEWMLRNVLYLLKRAPHTELPHPEALFAATPGDRLQIAIKARHPEALPEGELLLQRYWEWTAKDYAEAGRGIEAVLKPLVTRAAQFGLMLLAAGVALRAFTFISGRALSE